MTNHPLAHIGVAALALLVPSVAPSVASTAQGDLAVQNVPWRELQLEASKLLLTARATVRLDELSASQAAADLVADVGGRPLPATAPVALVTTETTFLGRHSVTETWLDARSASALQRRLVETGGRHRFKLYRFGREGVYAERREPAESSEEAGGPAAWSRRSDTLHPSDPGGLLTDASALFYLLAAAQPAPPREAQRLWVFSSSRATEVELLYDGAVEVKTSYTVAGAADLGKRSTVALRYLVRPTPGNEQEEVTLLGLESDIQILLEAGTRLPLEVSGRISPVGTVRIKLQHVAR